MKTALCINKDYSIEDIQDVVKQNFFLQNREGENNCEDNLNVWQILPYVVLYRYVNDASGMPEDVEFLTYRRGGGGGEKRLTSKYSIGFGGHVDTVPPVAMDKIEHLARECCRELNEELGIEITEDFFYAVRATLNAACTLIAPTPESTGVDAHHLGLLIYLNMKDIKLGKAEDGHIDELKWMSRQQMLDKFYVLNSEQHKLENWSDFAFQRLLTQ